MGLDFGERRVGVAISDPGRVIAHPVSVVARDRIAEELPPLVARYEPSLAVVGLPLGLDGREGAAAVAARDFGREVSAISGLHVEFYDERFSTVIADRSLREGGVKGTSRRAVVDKVAAAVMLQGYLDRRA